MGEKINNKFKVVNLYMNLLEINSDITGVEITSVYHNFVNLIL